MIKAILKMLITPERVAKIFADGIAKAVNNSYADTKSKIANISESACEYTSLANELGIMLKDGQIQDAERTTLEELALPFCQQLVKAIFK